MEEKTLVELIRSKVVIGPNPAIYISGGVDSTIILHHLREKWDGEIKSYHMHFGGPDDEAEKARKVAEYYETNHREVKIVDYISVLKKCMVFFSQPRYNIWPYWMAVAAKEDGASTVYIGEGSDEYFGGYMDRNYLYGWAGQIVYVRFTYDEIHSHLGLDLRAPFSDIPRMEVIDCFYPPDKKLLRRAYKDLIPDFVASQPPAFTSNYWKLWNTEIYQYFKDYKPETLTDVRNALQLLATKYWVESRDNMI